MDEQLDIQDKINAVGMRMGEEASEGFQIKGHMQAWLNGELIADTDNIITNVGHALAAGRFLPDTSPGAALSHSAIGTGTGAPAVTDTTLGSEVNRQTLDTYTRGTGANANVLSITVQFGNGEGSGLISECGLFNAGSAGTMFARAQVDPARQKNSSDTLDISWTLTF